MIVKACIFFLFILMVSFGFLYADEDAYPQAIVLYNSAVEDINNENFDLAIEKLENAIALYPDEKDFYSALGQCYYRQAEYRKAARNLKEYTKLNSGDPDPAINGLLGHIYTYYLIDYDYAQKYLKIAIESDPGKDTYKQMLGYVYEQLGLYDQATREYVRTDQSDEWTQQRLSSTSVSAYEFSSIFVIRNTGRYNIDEVKLWCALASSFFPQQVTEFLGTEPYVDFELQKDDINNPIAYFSLIDLKPDEVRKVEFRYRTQIFPQKFELPNFYSSEYDSHNNLYRHYISEEEFIETDHPAIVEQAKELSQGTSNGAVVIQNVYDYVRQTLDYNENPQTMGALYALQGGEMCDCSEFSMLFAALLRANQIPVRVIHGYTYDVTSVKKKTPHAWAEVLLPDGQWIPFDPTNGRMEPNLYYASHPSTHIGFWTYSTILKGDVNSSIYYDEDEGRPHLELSTDYNVQSIPLWYNYGQEIKQFDLKNVTKLPNDFQLNSQDVSSLPSDKSFKNAKLFILIGCISCLPIFVFFIINPLLSKKKMRRL